MSHPERLYSESTEWLFTSWNTVVYYERSSDELRHGPRHENEPNVALLTCGWRELESSGALLLAAGTDSDLAILWSPDRSSTSLQADRATVFGFRTVGDSLFLTYNGLYLCAEPDGRITLSRERAGEWERFLAARPRSGAFRSPRPLPSGLIDLAQRARALHPVQHAFLSRTRTSSAARRAVICNAEWLETYLAREHYHFARLLSEVHGYDLIDAMKTDLDSERFLSAVDQYELVFVTFFGTMRVPVHAMSPYTIVRIDDIEPQNPLAEYYSCHADMVVGPYSYEFYKYFPHLNVRWTPYTSCIEEEGGVLGFNKLPEEKVFVSGSVAQDRPFRQFVFELQDDRLAKLSHPGYLGRYDNSSREIVRSRWFDEINKYLAAFCDGHSLRYIHLRAFEVASVGTLLMADRLVEAEMNKLGFVDGVTCVFCDEADFLERVDWVLDPSNRGQVDEIRAAGMQLVLERHTTRHRVDEFAALADAALEASRST